MYEAKTRPTELSVSAYLAGIEDGSRREDCEALASLRERVTGCPPRMWGTSIVGFDSYHYEYAGGHAGDSRVVGFSSRKGDISLCLVAGYESAEPEAPLPQLGKNRIGQACLRVGRLSDVRLPVLEQRVARAASEIRRRYPR